jgi:Tol biopolymer transport system component
VYVPKGGAGHGGERSLSWVDRNGNHTPLEQEPRAYSSPHFSPDGQRVLLQIAEEGESDIWLYDVERETLARQTFDAISSDPVWTPDGGRFTFTSCTGAWHFYWKSAEGGDEKEQLPGLDTQIPRARSWSPDGTRLAYTKTHSESGADIWILSLEEQAASPFLATPANEVRPAFSPDGRWIAYESDESGQREVYLISYPDAGQKHQVSIAGGGIPRWRADGSELFYVSAEGELVAVDIETTPTLQLGAPHPLFELSGRDYDVHPSGRRFLIVRTERDARPGQINVVLNWFEELQRLVPTDP